MKKLLPLLFITLSLCTLGQTAKPKWVNYYSRTNVRCIVPDGNTMWVGTGGGVCQSDLQGNILQSFTKDNGLASNDIYSIAIDAQGNKWFGTDAGVSKFDGTTWTNYTATANGLAGNDVRSIAIDAQGNKWFGTDAGVSKFDGTNWTTYTTANGLTSNSIRSIAIDAQGNKWFGTSGGVSKFDGTNWTTYTTANGLASNTVTRVAIDAQGNKWFGTDAGVSKFDGTNWTTYTTANGLASNTVTCVAIDAQGNKWFDTDAGVSKFDGTNWTSYILGVNYVTSIAIDAHGNKWFGTNGVSTFDGKNWTCYTTANGLAHNYVTSIAIDAQGNKWFGTDAGVSKFDGTTWTTYTTANGLADDRVTSIAIDAQGNKWFGMYGGISKFDGSNWTNYTITNGFTDSTVSSIVIAIDAQENKWFGLYGGISKFDGMNWTNYSTANGLADNFVTSIAIDAQGNKWFGTNEGVSKFDGTYWTTYTTANGLACNQVNSIAIDAQGNKWIGTPDGVSKFDGTNWTNYTTANGLADDRVISIAIDALGNKWFGKNAGVSVFNENGVVLTYNKNNDSIAHIKGRLYFDVDKNASFSNGDSFLKSQKVLLLPDSISTFTNSNGEYSFAVNSGKTYTISIIPQAPYFKGSQALLLQVKASKKDSILPNIGLYGIDTVSFCSSFVSGIHRCGRVVPFYFTFQNTGTHPANTLVAIAIDKKTKVEQTIPTADSVGTDGRLFWKYNNLPISDDRQVQIQATLPSGTLDTLFYTAELFYKGTLAHSAGMALPTLCSYDPNDKQVSPTGINKEKLTLKNQQLQYTIRFQNTGNDYAYDVKIVDTIAASLNWSTLVVTASSHTVRTEITAKGIVTFYFDNIMLPDSGTNYIGSNGFVSYTIQPKSTVTENTKIKNTAHIIFDQNPAVITNTTLNTLVSTLPFTVAGDSDGNGLINNNERAGDINKNGTIDGTEILGDLNGDGIINNGELLGDANGNGILDGNEHFKKTVSTPEIEYNNSTIALYPIPVIDNLIIKINEGNIPSSIQIVNTLGQTVYVNSSPTETSFTVSLTNKPSGIYFVQIVIDEKTYSKIIVKK